MKRLLFIAVLFLFSATFVCAYTSPGKPTGYVNDFAGTFTKDQKATLENKIGNYARPAGVQIAVATVPTLGGDTIENYAVKLFEEWGIGSKIKDNGLLFLIAPNDREVRIEVGYGLEGAVTDADSSIIIRNTALPAFKEGKYYEGTDAALTQIMGLIDQDPDTIAAIQNAQNAENDSSNVRVSDYLPLVFLGLVIGFNLLAAMARSKSWWLGGVIGVIFGFFIAGIIGALVCMLVGLLIDFLLSRFGGKWFNGPRGPRGPWFIGGFGGGRGGSSGLGGFGGFGGGMSGGGGASGKW